MKQSACLFLILLVLSSCDIKKRLSRSKTTTQTTESDETITAKRKQLTEDWSQIGSFLFHRDGLIWIEFDSLTRIDISPTQQITAIGFNPVLRSSASSTYRDTTRTVASSTIYIQEDSTSRSQKQEDKVEQQLERAKDQKTQNIVPILVLSILCIITFLYAANQFKLF